MSEENPFKSAQAAPAVGEVSPRLVEERGLPPLSMEERSCRSCAYYDFLKGIDRVHAGNGECRRHAPTPGSGAVARWPVVLWNQWCGDWENGVSNEDLVRMARDIGENLKDEIL